MIAAVVVVALLALGVVATVAWPLIAGDGGDPVEAPVDPVRVALDDEIAASLQAIRELQFDHQAGSLDDDDFRRLDTAERANAARLIRRRSELDQNS